MATSKRFKFPVLKVFLLFFKRKWWYSRMWTMCISFTHSVTRPWCPQPYLCTSHFNKILCRVMISLPDVELCGAQILWQDQHSLREEGLQTDGTTRFSVMGKYLSVLKRLDCCYHWPKGAKPPTQYIIPTSCSFLFLFIAIGPSNTLGIPYEFHNPSKPVDLTV